MINAQRFESMRKDFNVPVTDFKSLKDSSIFNSPMDMLSEAKEGAQGLLSQLSGLQGQIEGSIDGFTSGMMDPISGAKDSIVGTMGGMSLSDLKDLKGKVESATRVTQSLFGTFTDVSLLPESIVTGFINSIIPDDLAIVSNEIKSMSRVCRNSAIGSAIGFGSVQAPKCNGMNTSVGNCSPAAANSILSGAVSGLNSLINAGKNLLGKILALANIGFNANLCGVFGSLVANVTDKSIVGMAASVLVNQQASKGKLSSILDISKTTSALGINVSDIVPSTIRNITTGVTSLGLNQKNEKISMSESYLGALSGIDPNWVGGDSADLSKVSVGSVISSASSLVLGTKPTSSFGHTAPTLSSEAAALAVMSSMFA